MADPRIAEFLRNRRSRVTPAQAGLPDGLTRRRVPGLRREEVAQLAGVSVDYYTRLEQGRGKHVSDAVLDAIATVLRLSHVERQHLWNLARPRATAGPPPARAVPPGVRRMLELMPDAPALVLGRRMRVLAWNPAAQAVFDVESMRELGYNAARHAFLAPRAAERYVNREEVAAAICAQLRLESGRHPDDPDLAALIGELAIRSGTFRRLWAANDVRQKDSGTTVVAHPVVGRLEFGYEALALPGAGDQYLTAYTYPAGSATAQRLQLLLSWTSEPAPVGTA
ncbi:helix-turn-helix transcriptional regulator [Saccharothrix coeruleofusca]|nr:helix-turn-helix transcriptional regulator [Saccharothrix coeruleofusca]